MANQLGPFFTADNKKIFLSINDSGFVECLWKSVHGGWESYELPQAEKTALHLFVYESHQNIARGATHCFILKANTPLVKFTLANKAGQLIPMGNILRANGTWSAVNEKQERIRAEEYKTDIFEITHEQFYQPNEKTKIAISSEQEEISVNFNIFIIEKKQVQTKILASKQERSALALKKTQILEKIRETEEIHEMLSEDHSWQSWKEQGRYESLNNTFELAKNAHSNLTSQQQSMIIAYMSIPWMTLKQETDTAEEYHQALLNILGKKHLENNNAYVLYTYTFAQSINALGKWHFYGLENAKNVPSGSTNIGDVHAFMNHAILIEIIELEKKYKLPTQPITIQPLPISERIHYIGELPKITHVNQPESLSTRADEQLTHLTAALYLFLNEQLAPANVYYASAPNRNAVINYSNQQLAQQSNEYIIELIELAITIGNRQFSLPESSNIADNLLALISPETPAGVSFDWNEAIAQKVTMQLAFKLLKRESRLELIQPILQKIKTTTNDSWETLLPLLSSNEHDIIFSIIMKRLAEVTLYLFTPFIYNDFPFKLLNINILNISRESCDVLFHSSIMSNFNEKATKEIIVKFLENAHIRYHDWLNLFRIIYKLNLIASDNPTIESEILAATKNLLDSTGNVLNSMVSDDGKYNHLLSLENKCKVKEAILRNYPNPPLFISEVTNILAEAIRYEEVKELLTPYQNLLNIHPNTNKVLHLIPDVMTYLGILEKLTDNQSKILTEIIQNKLFLASIPEINSFYTFETVTLINPALPQKEYNNLLFHARNRNTFPLSEAFNDLFVFLRDLICQKHPTQLPKHVKNYFLTTEYTIEKTLEGMSLEAIQHWIKLIEKSCSQANEENEPNEYAQVHSIINYLLADFNFNEKNESKSRFLTSKILPVLKVEILIRSENSDEWENYLSPAKIERIAAESLIELSALLQHIAESPSYGNVDTRQGLINKLLSDLAKHIKTFNLSFFEDSFIIISGLNGDLFKSALIHLFKCFTTDKELWIDESFSFDIRNIFKSYSNIHITIFLQVLLKGLPSSLSMMNLAKKCLETLNPSSEHLPIIIQINALLKREEKANQIKLLFQDYDYASNQTRRGTQAPFDLKRFFEILPDITTFMTVFEKKPFEHFRIFFTAVLEKIAQYNLPQTHTFSDTFHQFKMIKEFSVPYPSTIHDLNHLLSKLSEEEKTLIKEMVVPVLRQYIDTKNLKSQNNYLIEISLEIFSKKADAEILALESRYSKFKPKKEIGLSFSMYQDTIDTIQNILKNYADTSFLTRSIRGRTSKEILLARELIKWIDHHKTELIGDNESNCETNLDSRLLFKAKIIDTIDEINKSKRNLATSGETLADVEMGSFYHPLLYAIKLIDIYEKHIHTLEADTVQRPTTYTR